MPLRGPDHPDQFLRALEAGNPHALKALDGGLPWLGGQSGSLTYWGPDTRGPLTIGSGLLPGARADYAAKAGRLDKNAIVAILINWTIKQFSQSRLQLTRDDGDGQDDVVGDHPFLDVMKRPSPYYPGRVLWAATLMAYMLKGDAYWWKIPNRAGGVVGYRWLSPWMTCPKVARERTTGVFIKSYIYKVGSDEIEIPKEQIVHFRNAFNLDDERTGWNPLEAALTSVVGVNEGLIYTAAILENMGITPAVITGTEGEPLDDQSVNYIERTLNSSTGGASRGRVAALKLPVNIHEMGATPQSMALESILDRPISIICATFGVDPLALGLSADSGTYENVGQADKMGWKNHIGPMQGGFADDLQDQALPDFDPDPKFRVGWDNSKVAALQEDADARVNRAVVAYQGGLCSLGTAQGMSGLPVTDEEDEVWFASPHQGDPTVEPDEGAATDIDPMAEDGQVDPEEDGQAEAA